MISEFRLSAGGQADTNLVATESEKQRMNYFFYTDFLWQSPSCQAFPCVVKYKAQLLSILFESREEGWQKTNKTNLYSQWVGSVGRFHPLRTFTDQIIVLLKRVGWKLQEPAIIMQRLMNVNESKVGYRDFSSD